MTHETETPAGEITRVAPGSLAEALGVQPGDRLLAVNGAVCEDMIDVRYWAADDWVALVLLRGDDEILLEGPRAYRQPLGLDFAHPTFDTDVRRCDNLCEFCFVLQMAPHMRRSLYVKDDDYRYSFLYGQYVTLTNLDEYDWERIFAQRLSPLYISVHATDPALRRRCLRNPAAPDVMAQLRRLSEGGIETHTQIVVTPGLNDGPHLARSVHDLAALWPGVRSVSVVPVGLTKYHKYGRRLHTPEEMHAVLDACDTWQRDFHKALGVRFAYPTDEWYLRTERPVPPRAAYDGLALQENGLGMVRDFLDDWDDAQRTLPGDVLHARSLTLATGTLFAPTLKRTAQAFAEIAGIAVDVVPVPNRRLGETITVAGLLMGADAIAALERQPLGERVFLPRSMFNDAGRTLDDTTPAQIEAAIGRPVHLAAAMRDVIAALQA